MRWVASKPCADAGAASAAVARAMTGDRRDGKLGACGFLRMRQVRFALGQVVGLRHMLSGVAESSGRPHEASFASPTGDPCFDPLLFARGRRRRVVRLRATAASAAAQHRRPFAPPATIDGVYRGTSTRFQADSRACPHPGLVTLYRAERPVLLPLGSRDLGRFQYRSGRHVRGRRIVSRCWASGTASTWKATLPTASAACTSP